MPPSDPYHEAPTAAMPPTGGPYEPGPPYGGGPTGPGGPGGPDEPDYGAEPDPWYRQPGPVAALIAGVAVLVVALIALLLWTSGDDDDASDDTLPVVTTTSTSVLTVLDGVDDHHQRAGDDDVDLDEHDDLDDHHDARPDHDHAPADNHGGADHDTAPPATTTTVPEITVPPGANLLQVIQGNDDLSELARGLECTGLDSELEGDEPLTVLAPSKLAFDEFRLATGTQDICDAPDQLEPILQYHIIDTDLTAAQIEDEDEITTLGGAVQVNDDGTIGSTNVIVVPNVQGSNGLIQAVDAVVQP